MASIIDLVNYEQIGKVKAGGSMGFECKCTPQLIGLVRQDYPPGKHRANGKAILQEFCEERISDSKTLDPERSHLNTYWHFDGGVSGDATWAAMCQDADDYRVSVKLKSGEVKERKLREDAVIGWALVAKPPLEMIAALHMGEDDVLRFSNDTFDVMAEIEPRLFRDENLTAMGCHRDEDGLHYHKSGFCKDKSGKYCGKLIDPSLYVRIAQQFPALMRERGWPIMDNDLTDWDKYNEKDEDGQPVNPEYRAERQAKWHSQGQSVNEYSKSRIANAGHEAARVITDAQAEAQDIKTKAVQDAAAIKAKAVEDATQAAEKKLELLSGAIFNAQLEIDDLTEFKRWRAQKAAQETQDAAKREQAAQEAKAAQTASMTAQEARDAARREQEARAGRAAQTVQTETEEERRQKVEAALQAVPAAQVPQAEPPLPDEPKPGGSMATLRLRYGRNMTPRNRTLRNSRPRRPGRLASDTTPWNTRDCGATFQFSR